MELKGDHLQLITIELMKYIKNFTKIQNHLNFFFTMEMSIDSLNISELVNRIEPDEIYNLAAQSHVKVSFETPEYTANADGLGVLRILEAIRRFKKKNKILSSFYF